MEESTSINTIIPLYRHYYVITAVNISQFVQLLLAYFSCESYDFTLVVIYYWLIVSSD